MSIRTSITIDKVALQQIQNLASNRKQTVSKLIENTMLDVIARKKKPKEDGLLMLIGVGKADPDLKDKSVDEVLYGKGGAWEGSER